MTVLDDVERNKSMKALPMEKAIPRNFPHDRITRTPSFYLIPISTCTKDDTHLHQHSNKTFKVHKIRSTLVLF